MYLVVVFYLLIQFNQYTFQSILNHKMTNKLSFRVGLIADTQYADDDDGSTFDKSSVRRYRQSLRILDDSITYFKDNSVEYCVQLGDLLDSRTKRLAQESRCLNDIVSLTEQSGLPWSFCVGNHDLEAISRVRFHNTLIPKHLQDDLHPNKLHYDITPCDGLRFIFIDGYDISTFSATSEDNREIAVSLLAAKNKNLHDKHGDWFLDLHVDDMKYVPYNGALGSEQMEWIRSVLVSAKSRREKVVLFSHMPVYAACCRPSGILWNSDELLALLHEDQFQGVTVAVVAGHDHDGGYAIDSFGIHHLTPPAPLECADGESAYGYLTLSTDHFHHSESHGDDINNTTSSAVGSDTCDANTAQSNSHSHPVGGMQLHWVGKRPVGMAPEDWPTFMAYPNKEVLL